MSTLLILSRHLLDKLLSSWSPVWVTIPNFPHKIDLWAFLYFSFGIWPIFLKIWVFFFIYSNKVSRAFLQVLCHSLTKINISSIWSQIKVNFDDLGKYTSCKTSDNVLLSHTDVGDWVNLCWSGEKGLVIDVCSGGWGGGGANAKDRVSRFYISKGWHLILKKRWWQTSLNTTMQYLASFKTASLVLFFLFGSKIISLIATCLRNNKRITHVNVQLWEKKVS